MISAWCRPATNNTVVSITVLGVPSTGYFIAIHFLPASLNFVPSLLLRILAVYGVIPPEFRMSPHKVDSCRGLRTRPEETKETRGLRGVARRGERLLFPLAGCLSCGCTCRKYWRLLLKLAQGKRPCRIVVGSPYFLAQAFLPYQPGNFFLGARRPGIAAYPLG